MKRTIFSNGRRRTLRALVLGAAVALLAVPVAQARPDDGLDRAKNDVVTPSPGHGIVIATEPDVVDVLMAEPLRGVSGTGTTYFRADDFAPPQGVEAAPAASGIDWSETALWLGVGLAGSLGLLGLAYAANRGRVRPAHS